MANNNSLQRQTAPKEQVAVFNTSSGEVKLSQAIVKNYLSGGNQNVTNQEVAMFIQLCKYQKLNPFIKEAYLIKYGTMDATMVVSKDVFQKRANSHPDYNGKKAGLILIDENGELIYREGAFAKKSEEIVGGWCEVYLKSRDHAERTEVSFEEYAGRKKDGQLNNQWATKPATMIRKVAVAQALRETFTEELGALYMAEEFGMAEETLSKPEPQPSEQPRYEEPIAFDNETGEVFDPMG